MTHEPFQILFLACLMKCSIYIYIYIYFQIWSAANFSLVGSLPTTLEVRAMAISSELIYLGGKGGCVEIWDREKQNRIDTLQTGTNCKVLSLALDGNEEVLVTGTSDGRIQVKSFFLSICF